MNTQTATATAKRSTTREMASKAHDAVETAAAKSEPIEKKLRKQASKAGTKLEAGQEALLDGVSDSVDAVQQFARKRPLATAGIDFGAGILAAALMRR